MVILAISLLIVCMIEGSNLTIHVCRYVYLLQWILHFN